MKSTELDTVWKALADPARRRMLDLLRRQPLTTGALCEYFPDVTRYAVMKQLKLLVDAGLVVIRRRGRERWNYLNAIPLQQMYLRWIKPYEASWADNLINLAAVAESRQEENIMTDFPDTDVRKIRIEQDITINAPRQTVFKALTQDIAKWWGAPYLQNESAVDLRLESRLSGRLYEMWSEDEGAEWARVTAIEKNRLLELTGRLAMPGAVQCAVYFNLEDRDGKTLLKFSHQAVGDISDDIRDGFTAGWDDLLKQRLKPYVEEGRCHGVGYPPPQA